MTEKRRSTLRDVAARAGVSRTTVTRVLRGDRYVSDSVRARVEQAARELGYERNPAVSTVMSHIRRQRVAGYRGKLAWLNATPDRDGVNRWSWLRALHAGVTDRCGQVGYLLENIWLNDPSLEAVTLDRVLKARGTQGLVLHGWHAHLDALDLSGFACATTAISGALPHLHVAGPDLVEGVHVAWGALAQRGYQRIGLVLHEKHDSGTHSAERGAYLVHSHDLPARRRIPPLMLPAGHSPEDLIQIFGKWIEHYKPDAVLCCDENMTAWARELGISVPDDLALAHLARHPHLTEWAGIDQREEQIGAAAVDLVVGQLARGDLGIPPFQKEVLIKGQWVDGPTVASPSA